MAALPLRLQSLPVKTLSLFAITCVSVSAHGALPHSVDSLGGGGWYAGVEGGVPFAVGTFSSFVDGNVRAGWSAGVFAGYAFSRVVSLEAQAAWGRAGLGPRPCCSATNYWLGSDGAVYYAPVDGMEGWDYSSLKSRVALQSYGVQLNVDVLPWLGAPQSGRWSLAVSPRIAAVGTKAKLYETATGRCVAGRPVRWHLAGGFRLQAGYAVSDKLRLGVYTGMTFLTGGRMDGIPRRSHSSNYLWESGVRLSFSFGKAKRKAEPSVKVVPTASVQPEPSPQPMEEKTEPTVAVRPEEEPIQAGPTVEKTVFPTIYFNFNSIAVRRSELGKVDTVARMMAADTAMRVRLAGWCDRKGTAAVNLRVSLRRAEAVKRRLVILGVSANRIETDGKGVDYGQADAVSARRVEIVRIGEEGL